MVRLGELVLSSGCWNVSVCRFGEPGRSAPAAIWHLMVDVVGGRGRMAKSSLDGDGESSVAVLEDGRLNRVAVEADLGASVHQYIFT